jgi:hypothetical protein
MTSHFLLMLLALWALPLFTFVRWFAFEKRRWAESDHAG